MRAVLTEREDADARMQMRMRARWRDLAGADRMAAVDAAFADEVERAVEAALVPGLGAHTTTDADLVATLVEYARKGDEAGFRALAQMRGVPVDALAALWAGTVARLGGARGGGNDRLGPRVP
jgi:hypothetical protein